MYHKFNCNQAIWHMTLSYIRRLQYSLVGKLLFICFHSTFHISQSIGDLGFGTQFNSALEDNFHVGFVKKLFFVLPTYPIPMSDIKYFVHFSRGPQIDSDRNNGAPVLTMQLYCRSRGICLIFRLDDSVYLLWSS